MTDDAAARLVNDELIRSYQLAFGQPLAQPALLDLMRYCNFRVPLNNDTMQIEEGKRRVFLRIIAMMKLTEAQLFSLYSGRGLKPGDIDD